MLIPFDSDHIASNFKPFDAVEVAPSHRQPLGTEASSIRRQLIIKMENDWARVAGNSNSKGIEKGYVLLRIQALDVVRKDEPILRAGSPIMQCRRKISGVIKRAGFDEDDILSLGRRRIRDDGRSTGAAKFPEDGLSARSLVLIDSQVA